MLSILIVNWNTRDLLRACLESIRQTCAEIEHEVIVVDNASHDASAQMVRETFPEVHLVASDENLGFAVGNNVAFEKSCGEWVWLLNPDTEVLGTAPAQLIEFLEAHPKAGAAASALIDARDGHIQRSCRTFPTPAALWTESTGLASRYPSSRRFGFYRMGWWNYRDTRRVDQPMASSLLLRREAIGNSGGLFDEQFPIFFNDVDLCLRLKQSGWDIWFIPEAKVKHWGGAATGQLKPAMIRESHRSLRLFYEKHFRNRIPNLLYYLTVYMFESAGLVRYFLALRKAKMQLPTPKD